MFEHQRRVAEQRPAGVGDSLDIGQHVGGGQPPQALREIKRIGCGDRIAVHHLQRIAALDDVDARQRAPGAADRIEGAAAAGLELGDAGEFVANDPLGALQRFVREILQRQAAERQRHAAAQPVAMDADQFERAAAEIADDAVRIVNAGNDAERGQFCLARSGQDLDRDAADALGLGDEVGTVGGVAAGGGRNRIDAADPLDPAQRAKSSQRRQRFGDRVLGQQPGALDFAAEPTQRLFVEHGGEAARQRLVDHQTHRVRADIDDSDAGSALARSLHRQDPL